MALGYKNRRRLALLVLVVGLPLYIILAVNLVDWASARWGRLPFAAELGVFIGLGILWAMPLRSLFRGIGQPDPERKQADPADPPA
jgi:Protein of unknown function (DUF2842)